MSEGRGEKVALIAGGGALLWWLLRKGKGWPFGAGARSAAPCKVRLSGEGLLVDGKAASLADAVAACRADGRAEVLVTGSAIYGKEKELLEALRAADIEVTEVVPAHPAVPANGHQKPARGRRLSASTHDSTGTVNESAAELVGQARVLIPDLTVDEYTAARLVASEHASGSMIEMAAIIDAEVNHAERRGRNLFESLTWKNSFGKQGSRRRASTRLDPYEIHVKVARDVLKGRQRGISQGATQFFDPRVQLALAAEGKACAPLVILERWSFDFPWLVEGGKRKGCELDRRKQGSSLMEWVGEIGGIDPTRLMLLRPAVPGPEHVKRYLAAKELIETRLLGGKGYA